ncbi:MAG: hypothetical protein GY756_01490 [bacterium]|nr:hypothetical protein [bacterium]
MPYTTDGIYHKCKHYWRKDNTRTNRALANLSFKSTGSDGLDRVLVPGRSFFTEIQNLYLRKISLNEYRNELGRLAFICETAMALNMGKVCYTKQNGIGNGEDFYDSWEFKLHGNPVKFPIKNEYILRWEILRKSILTALGLVVYYNKLGKTIKNSGSIQSIHRDLKKTVDEFRPSTYQTLNNNSKRRFDRLIRSKIPILNEKNREKFLLRCTQVGCSYKYKPNVITREVYDGKAKILSINIKIIEPDQKDKETIKMLNLEFIDDKYHAANKLPFNILLKAVAEDGKVLTAQARKFLPYSFRNTYSVNIKYRNTPLTPKPFIITASPAPDQDKCFESQSELTEATALYYGHMMKALYGLERDSWFGPNRRNYEGALKQFKTRIKIRLISLITETGYFFGKRKMGIAAKDAVQKVACNSYGIFERINEQVTFTKEAGMLRASEQAIVYSDSDYYCVIHCESGVDRAGTVLEHIIYILLSAQMKGVSEQDWSVAHYIAAMANCAFSAMIHNVQFGIKPKAVYFQDLGALLPVRCQGKLAGKNKEFMSV